MALVSTLLVVPDSTVLPVPYCTIPDLPDLSALMSIDEEPAEQPDAGCKLSSKLYCTLCLH